MYGTVPTYLYLRTTAYTKTRTRKDQDHLFSTSLDCEELVSSGGRHLQAGAVTALSLS